MAFRKKTLRNMGTNTRKLARLINDLESAALKLKNFLPTVATMELESNALYNRLSTYEKKAFAIEFETLTADSASHDKSSEVTEIPHPDGSDPVDDGPLFATAKPEIKSDLHEPIP